VNPLLDLTGEHCAEGQSGSVWFLAGTLGGYAERNCTVPTGKMLFFPILNCPYIGFPTDKNDTCVDSTCSNNAERANQCLQGLLDNSSLTAQVDGKSILELLSYRSQSPVFYPRLPVDNIAGITAVQCPATPHGDLLCGPPSGTVDAGIYLMLTPLSRGKHVIHFSASPFLDVTYGITVKGK